MANIPSLSRRYALRLKRKQLLWRAFRARNQLSPVKVREQAIRRANIVLFSCMRNESMRIPHFLDHYRGLGVDHFVVVENDSDDHSRALLRAEPDVSVWSTPDGYRASRFGMDWLTWLQRRYAAGKWAVTVDADELLIYPEWESRTLADLTGWLERHDRQSFGAMLLELFPKGPPDAQTYAPGQDPTDVLSWFDAYGYQGWRNMRYGNVCLKGGVRARMFFGPDNTRGPFLNKIPLVRWRRSYAYVSSAHMLLPPWLNACHAGQGLEMPSGLLLHTKFLPGASARAREEKRRGEHFTDGPAHDDYYDAIAEGADMWTSDATRLHDWRQLVDLGLMARGDW